MLFYIYSPNCRSTVVGIARLVQSLGYGLKRKGTVVRHPLEQGIFIFRIMLRYTSYFVGTAGTFRG